MIAKRHLALITVLVAVACRRGDAPLSANGTIEATETDIVSTIPGRVQRLAIEEGETVQAGDTLVVLTSSTLPAETQQRVARLDEAQAQLRELSSGARPQEIAQAEAQLRGAEADADRASRDLLRVRALADKSQISQQQLDIATTAAELSASRRDAARQAVRLMRAGAKTDAIGAARARVTQARQAVEGVRATARELVLTAPSSGVVLARYVETGEVLPAGQPAMTIADPTHPWVRVFVGPAVLPRLAIGMKVTATLDTDHGRTFTGRIVALSSKAEFTPRVALTETERADLLFGVKIALDNSAGSLKSGLPVTVHLDVTTSSRRGQ